MRPDDMISVGPFEGTGLDMRSSGVLGIFRWGRAQQGGGGRVGHRGPLMVSGRGLVRRQVQALGLRLGPQTLKPPASFLETEFCWEAYFFLGAEQSLLLSDF